MSKKQLIIEKAVELFAENGFESTSVQQITERCGISKGAFYIYFKSKNELIIGLIDYFLSNIISNIEQSVSNEKHTDRLLYNFIFTSLNEFKNHTKFAKLFFKEQVFSYNKDLFNKLQMYMSTINLILLSSIQRQFPKKSPVMHFELLYAVNGLIKGYSELFFMDEFQVDLDRLCHSIVEKITIIADHSTLLIFSPEYLGKTNFPLDISKEDVLNELEEGIQETNEDPIVHDSLLLLKEDLVNPHLNEAIIQGLLKNIRTNKHCKWAATIYELYLDRSIRASSIE